jgi:hypothetical protein
MTTKLAESGLSKESLKNDTDVMIKQQATLAKGNVLDKVKLNVLEGKLRCPAVGRRDDCCSKF